MNQKLFLDQLRRLSLESYKSAPKLPFVVVLDNIRSLNNVGSFFRTCDAFRAQKLYLTGITGYPPHKEIYKSALGAENAVDWEYLPNVYDLAQKLKAQEYQIILIEQTSESVPLTQWKPVPHTAIFFGNEVEGISESLLSLADLCIEIPQYGTKHSLNVSVSGGIVIHYIAEYFIQQHNIKISNV